MSKEIYRVEDEQGVILVMEKGDKRVLSFGSDLQQSSVDMHRPYLLVHEYTQIMLLGLLFVEAKNITILGLGGGGLAHCLNHYFAERVTRVVELRQQVIDIAYQWFNLPKKANLKVICNDAGDYVSKAKPKSADLILSDLYEAQGMSEVQAQGEFIKSCKRMLSDDGWMVVNFHNKPEMNSDLMKGISALYSQVLVCDVFIGNWIVFCGNENIFHDESLSERARALSKKLDIPLSYYLKQLKKVDA